MSTSLKFEESYKKLNPAQKKAVDTIDGPVMVVAGPGSGKTEILSLRVANILRQTDTSPGNILCLTFTDSAAVNMRKRLSGLLGNSAYRVAIYTFHSFGTDVINSFPEHFFGGASLLPADDLASIGILEKIFSELSHDNPLTSLREGAYVYLPEAQKAISHLKKGGLTPQEFRAQILENKEVLEALNPMMQETFEDRLSKKNFEKIRALVGSLRALDVAHEISDIHPLHLVVANSLERAMNDAEEIDKTTPLSEWKKKWTEKNDDNGNVLKGTMALPKLLSLADIYEKYQAAMRKEGYFDFDDMILDVIHSLRENPALRYELQERFQYILVDEFQDTNDAQMRLIRLLTDAPVNEGRPNIMVVGDDDQAIYKFQGADISNILSFREVFRDPVVITMTENYRSVQKVLDLAREVIIKGEERLENKIPEMEKILTAGNKSLGGGAIHHENFETSLHEMSFVADEIRRLIDSGTPASDIAVIASKHRILESLVPFLSMQNVPVNYERKQNVLEEPHVRELITMTRFISSLGRKNNDEADEFLPEILSYPFWGIQRKTIWEISVRAKYKSWLGIMLESEDRKLRDIAEFFIDLGIHSQHETLEQVLDELMGSDIVSVAFTEDGDVDEEKAKSKKQKGENETNKFISPFKEYYFSREKFEKNRAVFLLFLSSLRTFVQALREHKQGTLLSVDDLLLFVELHDKNKIQVTDKSPFVSGKDSVTLLSAHKAKGMEFDTVFVLSCQDDVWAGRPKSSLLSFPKNLPLAPAGNTLDDHLRLFYVAITRAKRHLYLTSYHTKENGKESLPLQFLVSVTDEETEEEKETSNKQKAISKKEKDEKTDDKNLLFSSWKAVLTPPFVADEEALLKSLLEEYQMSVTHLNNFLDITHGGPQTFLEHNLLRFPSAKIPSGSYGSAMHHTIENIYIFLKREGDLPSDEMILGWFEKELKHERLSLQDHTYFLKKGKDALAVYLKEKKDSFDLTHKIETDFSHQGVILGEARITGKIDKMIPKGDSVKVVDFKTGKSFTEWDNGTPEEKIKLYKYRRQLIFYKLLVENSRDYGKFAVNEGVLEFLEPDKKGRICELTADITSEETMRTKALIEAVYKKIINLDLPDISKYSQDMNGIRQFEDDLIDK